jgi:hypothetical protein
MFLGFLIFCLVLMFLDIITDKKIGDRLTNKKELEED